MKQKTKCLIAVVSQLHSMHLLKEVICNQNSPAVKKRYTVPKKPFVKKGWKIQGGSQEMAIIVG